MPKRKETDTDFQARYLNALEGDISEIKETVKSILIQTQATNGRVTKLENKVFSKVVPWYSDSKLLYLALFCLTVFLLIVAAFLKVEIPAGLSL